MTDGLNNVGPPDMNKLGIGDNPIQQGSKYGVGSNNRDYASTNDWDDFWDGVKDILEKWVGDGGPGRGPGCGIGADFMVSEEEIIL